MQNINKDVDELTSSFQGSYVDPEQTRRYKAFNTPQQKKPESNDSTPESDKEKPNPMASFYEEDPADRTNTTIDSQNSVAEHEPRTSSRFVLPTTPGRADMLRVSTPMSRASFRNSAAYQTASQLRASGSQRYSSFSNQGGLSAPHTGSSRHEYDQSYPSMSETPVKRQLFNMPKPAAPSPPIGMSEANDFSPYKVRPTQDIQSSPPNPRAGRRVHDVQDTPSPRRMVRAPINRIRKSDLHSAYYYSLAVRRWWSPLRLTDYLAYWIVTWLFAPFRWIKRKLFELRRHLWDEMTEYKMQEFILRHFYWVVFALILLVYLFLLGTFDFFFNWLYSITVQTVIYSLIFVGLGYLPGKPAFMRQISCLLPLLPLFPWQTSPDNCNLCLGITIFMFMSFFIVLYYLLQARDEQSISGPSRYRDRQLASWRARFAWFFCGNVVMTIFFTIMAVATSGGQWPVWVPTPVASGLESTYSAAASIPQQPLIRDIWGRTIFPGFETMRNLGDAGLTKVESYFPKQYAKKSKVARSFVAKSTGKTFSTAKQVVVNSHRFTVSAVNSVPGLFTESATSSKPYPRPSAKMKSASKTNMEKEYDSSSTEGFSIPNNKRKKEKKSKSESWRVSNGEDSDDTDDSDDESPKKGWFHGETEKPVEKKRGWFDREPKKPVEKKKGWFDREPEKPVEKKKGWFGKEVEKPVEKKSSWFSKKDEETSTKKTSWFSSSDEEVPDKTKTQSGNKEAADNKKPQSGSKEAADKKKSRSGNSDDEAIDKKKPQFSDPDSDDEKTEEPKSSGSWPSLSLSSSKQTTATSTSTTKADPASTANVKKKKSSKKTYTAEKITSDGYWASIRKKVPSAPAWEYIKGCEKDKYGQCKKKKKDKTWYDWS